MRLAYKVGFSKARLCRNFLLDLRYSNKDSLELGLCDLYITQGAKKLVFF